MLGRKMLGRRMLRRRIVRRWTVRQRIGRTGWLVKEIVDEVTASKAMSVKLRRTCPDPPSLLKTHGRVHGEEEDRMLRPPRLKDLPTESDIAPWSRC